MKILFIGGTGTISMAISRLLVEQGWELYLLNRGSRKNVLDGQAKQIVADISKEQEVAEKIAGMNFDVVCDFIGFVPEQVERDYRLFAGKTKQYMYISSASAYHKPVMDYYITEGTNAYISVTVKKTEDLGSHTMFIGEITDMEVLSEVPSVTYEYYLNNIKPKPQAVDITEEGQTVWRCTICGYEYVGEELPEDFVCPLCKHPASDFEKIVKKVE